MDNLLIRLTFGKFMQPFASCFFAVCGTMGDVIFDASQTVCKLDYPYCFIKCQVLEVMRGADGRPHRRRRPIGPQRRLTADKSLN